MNFIKNTMFWLFFFKKWKDECYCGRDSLCTWMVLVGQARKKNQNVSGRHHTHFPKPTGLYNTPPTPQFTTLSLSFFMSFLESLKKLAFSYNTHMWLILLLVPGTLLSRCRLLWSCCMAVPFAVCSLHSMTGSHFLPLNVYYYMLSSLTQLDAHFPSLESACGESPEPNWPPLIMHLSGEPGNKGTSLL